MGTRARVFSQTLAHGKSKNKIIKKTQDEGKQRRVNMAKKYNRQKIKDLPTAYLQLGPADFPGSQLPKQLMDYLNDKNNVFCKQSI